MARFLPETEFAAHSADALRLLPLRFEYLGVDRYLTTNMVGDAAFLSGSELTRIASLNVAPGDGLYERAFSKFLIAGKDQQAQLQLLALRLRSRLSFLRTLTPLHIFVVTLRCEHSCPYCQVSRRSIDRERYDMSDATASRALDVAFSAPSPSIKIEFQGGEPLLNFELICKIVKQAEQRSNTSKKQVEFVITTNLALLSDDVLSFCKQHSILVSTSLDGPADLHNRNRPRPGNNSHALVEAGIRRAQEALGRDHVGALMVCCRSTRKGVRHELMDREHKLCRR
jgi:sulfatase maturation enzyme AslB (radical SAM superfamily)